MRPAPGGNTGFFTSRELMRISSAIFLLGIVGLLFMQSQKTALQRMAASEQEAAESSTVATIALDTPWKERVIAHPGHLDAQEIDALKEELQAVSDLAPLAAEEMPAYWRLVKWAYAAPGENLREQARKDLLFTHLFQASDKYRGALVNVKLHVRRMAQHEAPKNSANVTRVYEAWGPTEDSQTFPYCVVFVDVPPGVEVKPTVFFEARFVGVFLKKLAYEDATGTMRSAPLLIGRMINDEEAARHNTPAQGLSVSWIVGIVCALVGLVLLIQWWAHMQPASPRMPMTDELAVDSFLGELESGSLVNSRQPLLRSEELLPPD